MAVVAPLANACAIKFVFGGFIALSFYLYHAAVPATFRAVSPRDAVRGGVRVYRHVHMQHDVYNKRRSTRDSVDVLAQGAPKREYT